LDFDNTIVCYDSAIEQLANELLSLPRELPRTKLALRNFLRTSGKGEEWTTFQGELYGPGMRYAKPFDDAIATMQSLVAEGHELSIISHRSRVPYQGTPHDLHGAARKWIGKHLSSNELFNNDKSQVYFLESRAMKLACISELACHAFLDDLPEVIEDSNFPPQTIGILFDVSGKTLAPQGCRIIKAWSELSEVLTGIST